MEDEVVEGDNGVIDNNNSSNNNNNNSSSMAIDMALPGGFEGDSALIMDSSVETADFGEDWVSLFFDESYLNAMTTNGEVEQPFFQGSDGPATAPDADGNPNSNQVLSQSTMILSSSHANGTSGCPYSANVDIYPDNDVASGKNPLPTTAAISAPGTDEIPPPLARPTGSPESTITQGSGASSCAMQPFWWGNEDLEEDGSQHPENGSEEESSTSNFEAPIPAAGVPQTSKVPIQAQEVKGRADIASSVGKIATGVKGSAERSDRKRRLWEREEAENGQQQSCAQSEIDRKGSESGDGAGGDEDDEKRQARLMRNRESAQLSRQRKKVYVDELEGRLRTMAATIAELNATINHLTAENVNLRRQLGFFYQPARPGGAMPVMQYPGLVTARPVYPGAPMPPVPIPRLKPQQSLTKAPKRTKSSKEPGEKKKVKKVASLATVGVMGLLCITMLLGPFDWGSSTVSSGTTHIHVGNAEIRVGGRVLTSWNEESENLRNMTPREPWADGGGGNIGNVNAAGSGGRNGIGGKARSRSERRNGNILRKNVTAGSDRVWQSCSECYSRQEPLRKSEPRADQEIGEKLFATNVSEQVSVIVPRNNRLVKVDGNLIIRAVMAGDKAAEDSGKEGPSGQEGEKGRSQIKQDLSRSSRSPPTPADHQLIKAISTQAQEGGGIVVGERQSRNVGAIREDNDVQKPTYKSDALASVSATPTFSQLVLGSLAAIGFDFTSTRHDRTSVQNESSIFTTISPGRNTTQVGLHPEVVFTILAPSSGWKSVIDQGDPRNKTWLAPNTCEAVAHLLNVTLGVHECPEQPLSFGKKVNCKGYDRCRRLLQYRETFPNTVGGLRLRTSDFRVLKVPEDHLQVAHILVNNQSHVGVCQVLWGSTTLNFTSFPIHLQPIPMSATIFDNKDMEEAWFYPETFLMDRPGDVQTDLTCRLSMWVKGEVEGGSTVMNVDRPVLSTGMCTEVFRFDTSPAGAAPSTDASRASSSVVEDQVNAVGEEQTFTKTSEEPPTRKKRDPYAVPLPPIRKKDRNGTEPVVEKVFKGQQSETEGPDASTMVVSVFTGPQDVSGEESRTGAGTGKGLSQIFVVVLVDSVKYITYSCMLPPTGSQVHVVAS